MLDIIKRIQTVDIALLQYFVIDIHNIRSVTFMGEHGGFGALRGSIRHIWTLTWPCIT
ncbi:MAG: hypothetical protein GY928_07665 [Colwellia sp.]|nr:hypothetical protein [Colwellia sp.]